MLHEASPWLIVLSIAAALFAGLTPVALVLASGSLSGKISAALTAGATSSEVHSVYVAFVIVLGLFLLAEVLVPIQNRLRWLVTKRVDGAARRHVMNAALAGSDMTHLHGDEYRDAMGLAHGLIRWSATPGGGAAGIIGVSRDYLTGFTAAIILATEMLNEATVNIAQAP